MEKIEKNEYKSSQRGGDRQVCPMGREKKEDTLLERLGST